MNIVLHYVKQLTSFSGRRLYFNLAGMVVSSLLDGIGILLLIPMLSISGIVDGNVSIPSMDEALSFLREFPVSTGLILVLGAYLVISVTQFIMQRKLNMQNVDIHQSFIHELRLRSYRELLSAKWEFYLNRRKSDIINTLTAEMSRVNTGVHLCMQTTTSIIFTVIQIGLALWISAPITLLVVISGVLLALFSRRFSKRSMALGRVTVELSQQYMAGITDLFNGIKEVKSNRLEHSRMKWVQMLSGKLRQEQREFTRIRTASQLLYKISSAVLIAAFIYTSVIFFQSRPEQMIVIIVIFSRLWPRFINIQANFEQVSSFIPAFRSLYELQKHSNEEAEHQSALAEIQDLRRTEPLRMKQGIGCRNVYFRYRSEESGYALENVSLQIPVNQMTAIVGRSGAGKSTLIDLIMGLIQPEEGEVLIDGKPLTGEKLKQFRHSISYVPQDPFLFHGSIRDNLLLVEPDATDERIWEALELSAAASFIRQLPQRLDTLIGDRGIKISGGERQRLVLGRALLRKPSILVLDEATSALDTENETKIQEVLDQLRGKTTILVIAHRFSTIRNADQVIVLDQGRIVQNGDYKQLALEQRGLFRKLLGARRDFDNNQPYEGEVYDWRSN
ncbi:ABC transporter ATP-binding protein [Paenibacillus spongiae]|uniref:ABC transporter ATP-binding protein/permease n=1 Tax=Paenibacillus spongiae TaxID=2909671 RepID=A0ABY5SC39_9BACL|nr:ABC transporter ATP-binding protein [Paenibacillus spongiae]UVI31516.1 ABC transporter ATP-binding protein/permease [Paenibacillus spongiae]